MRITSKQKHHYSREYLQLNPALVFGLILISCGIYAITWIYTRNKEFEILDKHTPNHIRGSIVLMLLPLSWFYIIFIIKKLIMNNLFIEITQITIWGILIFLILKYLYDFCMSFGKITKTNGIYWFLIIPIFIITIPIMQAELNSHFSKLILKSRSKTFYG